MDLAGNPRCFRNIFFLCRPHPGVCIRNGACSGIFTFDNRKNEFFPGQTYAHSNSFHRTARPELQPNHRTLFEVEKQEITLIFRIM